MILNGEYVEKLTDEELCMLEQLTYLDEDVAIAAGIDARFTKINMYDHGESTISDILQFFDEDALAALKTHGEAVGDAVISGVEWARIIEYLQTSRLQYLELSDMMLNDNNYHSVVFDKDLNKYVPISEFRKEHEEVSDDDLSKYDIMRVPLALCFTDGSEGTNEAIIAYKGTTGPDEWADNVYAGYNYSSPPQEAALDFANDMVNKGYTKLTVTGHSKGSNKAMFVTILCNNVVRCVGFDGEGFSEQFLRDEDTVEKIIRRASLITNYSLSSDFVNILLYQIPGATQIHCKGYGVDGIMENHSPNSFFVQVAEKDDMYDYYIDEYNFFMWQTIAENNLYEGYFNDFVSKGYTADKYHLAEFKDGIIQFEIEQQKEKHKQLHELVCFLLSQGDEGTEILEYVRNLLPHIVPSYDNNGNVVTTSEKFGAIFGDLDVLGKTVAHLIYYIKENNMDSEDLNELLSALHVEPFGAVVNFLIDSLGGYVVDSLIDDNDDYSEIVTRFYAWRFADFGINISDYMSEDDFISLWIGMKYEYKQIERNNVDIYTIYDIDDFLQSRKAKEIVGDDNDYIDLITIDNIGVYDLKKYKKKVEELFKKYGYSVKFGNSRNNVIGSDTNKTIIFGGAGPDILYGNSKDDIIYGGHDSDIIVGGSGDDIIYSSAVLSSKSDRIYGGDGNDIIYASGGDDFIYGDAGEDTIYGDYGNDCIYGGSGKDYILGEDGEDIIYGGTEQDRIYGGYDDDVIRGGDEKDWIYGGEDNDTLYGDEGDDIINGGIGNDTIYGNEQNDILMGNKGNDTLNGGFGDDTLRGGDNSDTYHFYKNAGNDTIYDQYGSNIVVFKGMELSDLSIAYTGLHKHDLTYTIISTGETLTILDYRNTADNFRYSFESESGYYNLKENEGVVSFFKTSGSNSGSGYDSHWDKMHDNSSNSNTGKYKSATVAQPPRDPLVIDLGEDGIELTTIDDGVYFDLDKNGFAEKTAWIGIEDGFLVLDRNGNGIIDDGGELFSDQVVMSSGEISSSGFSALADLDDNANEADGAVSDGIIDAKDAEFANLRVWIDANHNGITDEGELKSLDELEIASISLNHIQTDTVDSDTGTIITETSEVVFKNGTVREISEHWFQINSADTEEINVTNIDDNLTSFGNMHSLSYALENDTSGELQELVDSFMNSDNYVDKRVIARKILYYITNSSDIAVNSRGGAIDARNLHVLETIMGVDSFVGVNGSTTPNSNAASILNQLFSDFDRTYFILLNEVLGEADYLELIEEISDDNGEIILDLSAVEDIVDHYISLGINVDEMLFNIGVYLKSYDSTYGTDYLNSFKSHYSDRADEIGIMVNGNFVVGTEENDNLNGSSSQDVIWAEGGNDNISTGAGNDLIYGGAGNDTIKAGAGADIVYGEDGNDIINADSGNDTIYAGTGDDIVKAGADNDLVYGEEGNDAIDGGAGNDTLFGGTGGDTINAGEGDDVVYGEDGNDTIDSGAGNDTVDAGTGNDVINSGEGDDTLAGGEGDDTYHFGAAHGNDIVFDADGANMLKFGDELSADDYDLSVDINGGFVLTHKETGETISLPDFVTNPLAYDFTFAGEGKVLGGGEEREIVEGTDEDNILNAGDGFNIIYGNGSNDTIEGGENLDFVFGGDGNDTISGDNGTNILHGEAGNDTLSDGEGSSYLNGGVGDDTFFAGAGNDVLLGATGADEMHGEDGDDVLAGNDDDDTLYGEAGADTLYADAGNDTLYGGDDDDTLFGGDGDDTLHGEAGNDYLESGNGNNTMYGGDGDDTFVTGEDTDYVYGGTGNDYVIGGNGDNYIYGEDGDDRLQGGEGYDYMEGGLGNDNLSGGNGFNEMYGQEGNDYIYGGDHADYIDGGIGNDYLYGANATDGQNEIYGREGKDTIYDGDQGAYIEGNEGDDTIRAGGGNDVIDGGVGNDYIQDDHGDDTVIFKAGYGTDTISDAAGNNTLILSGLSIEDATAYKEGSDLKLAFSTGDNLIIKQYFDGGAFQNFSIDGVLLGDLISGYHGTENDDWMSAFNGNDTTLYGDGGNDNISGNNGSDTLYGGSGNDTLNGGENADTLDGGEGTDSLYGGNGDDTYVFSKGDGSDTIEDWNGSSIVKMTDINIDEVSISNSNDSALVLTVDSTGDTLTLNGYKWNQGGYTFEFADGTTDTVNKDTWNWESGFGTSSDDTTGEDETTQPDADVTDGYVLNGSANGEWLSAPNNNDVVIDAGDGDDGLNGGSGNDKLYGGVGTDNLYGNDGDDILDGGTGMDGLNGGNGTDTYIFAKGYGNDSVNEWGTDKSIVKFTDINSDEVTIVDQWGNLLVTVNDTEDTLTINNFKWGQSTYSFEFADGAIASVNKDTFELEFSKLPDIPEVSEDEIAQSNAELLTELYAEDSVSTELVDNTIISEVTESTTVSNETNEIADMTDIQLMILTENMSAFADEANVYDTTNITDTTTDTALNQLLVNSAV